jgi:putative ABC transport system permease protein
MWALMRSRHADEELAREMASHRAAIEEDCIARGASPEDARLAARRAMGSTALARDLHRDARTFAWIADAQQDLRFALRMLRRSPGFAVVTILTMALSIGATTTLFSLAYGVLMRPLPWPDQGRLIRLEETRGGRLSRIRWTMSNAAYLAWREHPTTIEDVGGWTRGRRMTLALAGDTQRIVTGTVTPSLFRVLGVRPEAGQLFAETDSARTRVVILSHGLWQRRFGGRPEVVGMSVRLDDQAFTIVGVMPRTFSFPTPDIEAWTAFGVPPVQGRNGTISLSLFSAIARVKPGVTAAQAAAEATARARTAPDLKATAVALFGTNGIAGVTAAPALDVMTADVKPALMLLLAAVGLLFAASTASLIVLQLSRVARRRREIAVRTAIGAGAARLIRQWLVESAILGTMGAAAGLLATMFLHRALPAALPAGFPRVEDVQLDWRVAAFGCVGAGLVSLACGMVPAFRGRPERLVDALADGPSSTPPLTGTPAARARTLFMAAQMAVACILLVGASLLMRSFLALLDVDRGFDPHGVLTMQMPMPAKFVVADHQDRLDRLQHRLHSLPGVSDVGLGNALPFATSGGYRGMNVALPRDPSTKIDVQMMQRSVTPEYFRAMGLRLSQGRAIAATDTTTAPGVIVVNRTFAARYLGDQPLGQRLDLGNNKPSWEIVGVVDDMRQGPNSNSPATSFGGVLDPPLAEVFFPLLQWSYPIEDLIVVLRTTGDPAALATGARAIVREVDPTLPIDSMMTMDERVAGSVSGPRTYAVFLVGFALCALAIAGVGLFGVLSYATAQRTREIGLRAALGAQRRDLLTLVARQALAITLSGLAAGLLTAFFLSQTLSTLLYGVSTRDAISFTAVPVLLLVVSLLACAVPAWRATRIDPLTALRSQ